MNRAKPRARARLDRERARRKGFAPLASAPPPLRRVFELAGASCDHDPSVAPGALVVAFEGRSGAVDISWKPYRRGVEDLAGHPGGRLFLPAVADAERIRAENGADIVILAVLRDGSFRAGAFRTRRDVPAVNTWGGERGLS